MVPKVVLFCTVPGVESIKTREKCLHNFYALEPLVLQTSFSYTLPPIPLTISVDREQTSRNNKLLQHHRKKFQWFILRLFILSKHSWQICPDNSVILPNDTEDDILWGNFGIESFHVLVLV